MENKINNCNLKYYLFSAPFHGHISLSNNNISSHIIIQINKNNLCGFGEAPCYSGNILEKKKVLDNYVMPAFSTNETITKIRLGLKQSLGNKYPDIYYAVSTALYDLEAKNNNIPLSSILGERFFNSIPITKQVFIDTKNNMINQAVQLAKSGCKDIKIKIGRNPNKDIELLKTIKSCLPSDINIRVDINHSYSVKQAIFVGNELKKSGIDYLEEPCDNSSFNNIAKVKKETGCKIILDESIKSYYQLREAIKKNAMDVLNIKLSRIGGIDYAIEYINICNKNNINILIGCSEELGIGMATISHIASTVRNLHSIEGSGYERLGFDIIESKILENRSKLFVPDNPGLGVAFSEINLLQASYNKNFKIINSSGSVGLDIKSKILLDDIKRKLSNLCLLFVLFFTLNRNPRKSLINKFMLSIKNKLKL